MAFASVSNSAGMLHHGANMAWDAVSATRAVMVTVTGDFKALVQEVNFVNNATVLGTPSFVKQINNALATYSMRPRIKSLGNNRIFVMVPSAWAVINSGYMMCGNIDTAALYGAASTDTRNKMGCPSAYDCFVMERDASGNYKTLSTLNIPVTGQVFAGNPSNAENAFTILSATDTQIVLQRGHSYVSGTNAAIKPWLRTTITMANGVMSGYVNDNGGTAIGTLQYCPFDIRHKKLADGSSAVLYSTADRTGIWQNSSTRNLSYTHYSDAGIPSIFGYTAASLNINPQSWVPIDATSKFFDLAGDLTGNTVINGINSSNGQMFYYPLDAAWISPTVVGIIGFPNDASVGPIFDVDAAISVGLQNNGVAKQLFFSARELAGNGSYVGPYDPIALPYYAMSYMNRGNMIMRIDDTHFWIFGCFMADANAAPKIGVITVSV